MRASSLLGMREKKDPHSPKSRDLGLSTFYRPGLGNPMGLESLESSNSCGITLPFRMGLHCNKICVIWNPME